MHWRNWAEEPYIPFFAAASFFLSFHPDAPLWPVLPRRLPCLPTPRACSCFVGSPRRRRICAGDVRWPAIPRRASHDGIWRVTIITQSGNCGCGLQLCRESGGRPGQLFRRRRLRYLGRNVGEAGNVNVSIARGDQRANASGKLNGATPARANGAASLLRPPAAAAGSGAQPSQFVVAEIRDRVALSAAPCSVCGACAGATQASKQKRPARC